MAEIKVNSSLCDLCGACKSACPFGAIEIKDSVEITAACKLCRICVKTCPKNAIVISEEEKKPSVNTHDYKGIAVFVEHFKGKIHPVTIELIGKAKELCETVPQKIYAVFIGHNIEPFAKSLLAYGVDEVYIYDSPELEHFRADLYANAMEDFVHAVEPSIVMTGATSVGRSLAPKVATRFRSGLTADCTELKIRKNSDLVQIRPAFGGNIMAQIVTTRTRPQFVTVRYKVMDKAKPVLVPSGKLIKRSLPAEKLSSGIKILEAFDKEKIPNISDAEIIVAVGRGLKNANDLPMIERLASLLGAEIAGSRPMIENGTFPYTKQIGLSGRTVKPRLIITCGISGAVQFTASMNTAETIIAINKDKTAPIFKVAHYGIVGDMYEIIPMLIQKIEKEGKIL